MTAPPKMDGRLLSLQKGHNFVAGVANLCNGITNHPIDIYIAGGKFLQNMDDPVAKQQLQLT